jgi:serine protease Do
MLVMTCYLATAQPGLAQIPEFSGGKLPTLAPLVREVTPSVVNISVVGELKRIILSTATRYSASFWTPKEI